MEARSGGEACQSERQFSPGLQSFGGRSSKSRSQHFQSRGGSVHAGGRKDGSAASSVFKSTSVFGGGYCTIDDSGRGSFRRRQPSVHDCFRRAPRTGNAEAAEGDCNRGDFGRVIRERQWGRSSHENVTTGPKDWARKGFKFRVWSKTSRGKETALSHVECQEGGRRNFWSWHRENFSAVSGGRQSRPSCKQQSECFSVSGIAQDVERKEQGQQFPKSEPEPGRLRGQFIGKQQWTSQWKAQRCGKSTSGFQTRPSTDAEKTFATCAKVYSRGRRSLGCKQRGGLQPERLHEEIAVGEAENIDASPLRSFGATPNPIEGEIRTSCTPVCATPTGHLPELSGQWWLESSGIAATARRPTGASKIRRRGQSARASGFVFEGSAGAREKECHHRSLGGGPVRSEGCQRPEERQRKEKRRGTRNLDASEQVSQSTCAEECKLIQLIRSGHGSFARFTKAFERSRLETRGSTLNPVENNFVTLFPSMLPWIKPPSQKSRGRRGFTNKRRWEALSRMHQLWSLFNFLEGGSPCRHSATHAVVNRASSGVWTSCHEGYARAMYKKILRFVLHPEGTLDRGTAKLNDLISRIQLSFYDPSITLDEAMSSAMPVNPNRISLPEQAGVLNPAEHLVGQQLEQFKRMHLDVPSKTLPGKKIKPCHKVLPDDWPLLLRKLHAAGMINFLPVEDVLHEDGKPVVGGLFCVPHKAHSDRLINDRRPLNQREERLGWSNLPAGHMLCQVILEKGESIRCSGDDLSNYFYLIQHTPEWMPRNCFGTPFLGRLMPGVGLNPYKKYFPAFKVVCMGDTNGVDIAQAVHESVLRSVGCLSPAETLVYGKTFPASNTLEGLYIDDHLVFQILPKRSSRQRQNYRDEDLLEASRNRYQELNLPTSAKKAFQKDYDFKAWGTQVTSETGRVGTPYSKIRQIEALTCALVEEGWASKRALQKLLGLFIHPYMHRRELMAIFHHTYLFIEQLPETGIKRIPWYVKDELTSAALLLPFAEANIRTPVSVQISATDASSKMGGRASTITSRAMSKLLYRFAEKRGEHTRLDWDLHGISPPSRMAEAPPPVVDAMCKHCWVSSQSIRFDRKEHINILELEMVKQEIKARANAQRGGCRVVNLCDSRVVVGAFAKGRSSSRNLNHKLRSCIPWLLASEIHLVNVWVPTDKNPADYPSRGKIIPEPPQAESDPLLEARDLKAVRTFRFVEVQQFLECEARTLGKDPVYDNMDNPLSYHGPHASG